MKKLLIMLLIVMLLLTACQSSAQTAAENYLATHSGQEIVSEFEQLTFTYENFDTPTELSNKALIDFVTAGVCHNGPLDLAQWYDAESNAFLVPEAEIYAVLDKYFGAYDFQPEKCWYYDYNSENKILTISAVGGGSATSYDLVSAEALDDDNIKVTLLAYTGEGTKHDNPSYYYITARIIDNAPQFTSFQTSPNLSAAITNRVSQYMVIAL